MRALIDGILKQLREFFRQLSNKERIRHGIFAAVVIVPVIIAVSLLGRTNYVVLYPNLSYEDASAIAKALTEMGATYRLDGATIRVPDNMASGLNVRLRSEGYLSEDFNLDILNDSRSFNITEEEKKTYAEYMLGQSIMAQIESLDKIESGVVLVHLGEDSPDEISKDDSEASASAVLQVKQDATLTIDDANIIAEIVRASVPGIKYENISVTDNNLNSYVISGDTIE